MFGSCSYLLQIGQLNLQYAMSFQCNNYNQGSIDIEFHNWIRQLIANIQPDYIPLFRAKVMNFANQTDKIVLTICCLLFSKHLNAGSNARAKLGGHPPFIYQPKQEGLLFFSTPTVCNEWARQVNTFCFVCASLQSVFHHGTIGWPKKVIPRR